MPKSNLTLHERFLEKTSPEPNSGCWIWTGSINASGYGTMNANGKTVLAHRYIFEKMEGGAAGKCVCHKCDNRLCVNPDHLWLGSVGDNNRDRHAKGRSSGGRNLGKNNPAAKIDWPAVHDIRSKQESRRIYAERYGITYFTVRDIEIGRIWKETQIGKAS